MRRFIIALALVVFMAGAANAEGMMFGFKAGLNLANVTGDDANYEEEDISIDPGMRMVFGGGLWFNYAITEAFSVQPEVMFMMKGTKYEESVNVEGTDVDASITAKLTYVDINLLAKYTIPTEGNFSPFITVGPQLGMLMSAKVNFEVSAMGETFEEEEDIKDSTKSIDFGLVLGAGFDYMLESGCVTFDVRYVLGLTTIDDPEVGDAADVKNTGIQFLVGYGFSL